MDKEKFLPEEGQEMSEEYERLLARAWEGFGPAIFKLSLLIGISEQEIVDKLSQNEVAKIIQFPGRDVQDS